MAFAILGIVVLCAGFVVGVGCNGGVESGPSSSAAGGDSAEGGRRCVLQGDKCVGEYSCVPVVQGYRVDMDRHCVEESKLVAFACASFDAYPSSPLQIECGQRGASDGSDGDTGPEIYELLDPIVDPLDAGLGFEPCPLSLAEDQTWRHSCP